MKGDFAGDVSKSPDELCAAISETELGKALAAQIEHEVTVRACVDTQLSDRVGTLEGHATHATHVSECLDRLIDCVRQFTAAKAAK
nr:MULTISPECIES: hypothetical protein [Pseudomonas syringae group]